MSIKDIFATMEYGPAPEDPGPALDWLERRGRRFGHFIGGSFVEPAEGGFFPTLNPATGEELAETAQGTAADVDAAVAAARAAQPGWEALSGFERARHLYALARHLQKHSRLFALLETLDNGKPIRESRDIDVPLAIRHFYHHAGSARLLEKLAPGGVPWGVAGQIIPWNFPLLMLAWKVAPALAAGNTVVLKPAEQTPLSALRFAEACREIGLPPGVVNIVTGDGETGALVVAHEGVDKIAFTGSTEVGRRIREATAGSGKGLTLELGGKSPFIVFDDADLDSAVEGVVDAIWFNQGEVCCAGSRLLLHEPVAEDFLRRLRARMETLRVGDPLDKAIDIGAIVSEEQKARIEGFIREGAAEGGEVHQPDIALPNAGFFCRPTLVTGLDTASRLMQEEIFGPVLVSTTFRTPDEAVMLANNTRYGLAAAVWSENINTALDIAARLEAGVVWINGTNMFDAAAPFGGRRESGFGREGGTEGLWAYLRPAAEAEADTAAPVVPFEGREPAAPAGGGTIDKTAKHYVGGRQVRPDGGQSLPVFDKDGRLLGHVGRGNRKDIRNAVEAARKAQPGWAAAPGHLRAQILYYLAENLDALSGDIAARLATLTARSALSAEEEVAVAIERLFGWAAHADHHDGAVRDVPLRGVALAMRMPQGVIGALAPAEVPLLGAISLIGPALATGNALVLVPSEPFPLVIRDLTILAESSDIPAGVLNMVTGRHAELGPVLADHHDVHALWHFGDPALAAEMERRSAATLKRTWTSRGRARDWFGPAGEDAAFLRHASDTKTVWIPWGA